MKLYRRLCITLTVVILFSGFLVARSMAQVSRPGKYSGYTSTIYSETVRSSRYVAMRDGIKLAVDILRPAKDGTAVDTPYPVLWSYNWGGRATGGRHAVDRLDEIVKHGYVVAFVDARGCGASYGVMVGSYARIEAQDAYDMTEWLGTQPWSNGKVGMMGCSHSGQIEWLAAGMKPPHLKAIFPQCYSFDYYFGKSQGGIPGMFRSGSAYEREKTSAPVDEDPTGAMRDEAVEQHRNGRSDNDVFSELPYRDSLSTITNSRAWEEASPGTYLKEIQESGIPIYQWASWNDFLTKVMRDAFIFRANVETVHKTSVGQLGHCGFGDFDLIAEELRWFDYWLKGIDNGIMDEPPVYYSVLNADPENEWRFSWKWPLPNENAVTCYLGKGSSESPGPCVNDGILTPVAPESASAKDSCRADYTVTRDTLDSKGFTYTSEPYSTDTELIGYVKADIWVSSSESDQDFFAFLEDIDETGKGTVITQFQLRGSHRALSEPFFDNLGLPWRANNESEAAMMPPDQPVKLVFDPMPVSYAVKKGNRIRFTIVNSYPGAGYLNPEGAVVSIYRDKNHVSSISLPVANDPLTVEIEVKTDKSGMGNADEFSVIITPPFPLGKGYRAEDIDVSTLMLNGAGAVSSRVSGNTLVAKFRKPSTGKAAALDVSGNFNYGIPFRGSKSVQVK